MSSPERAAFDKSELAVVLSHYDLGVIESVTDFNRGSRRSPKVGIVCERGKFLLKRRSIRRAEPDRVHFAHRVQQSLAAFAFPVAKLVVPREQQHTFLQLGEHIYEMFTFVPGHAFEKTPAQARSAGAMLAKFHLATERFSPSARRPEPHGDYHDAPGVRTGLCSLAPRISLHDSLAGNETELSDLLKRLLAAYDEASDRVNGLGFRDFEPCVIHSDWHPGNLLYRRSTVVAVLDYDSVRWSTKVVDVANGALQFSMCAAGDVASWPPELNQDRFSEFLEGYRRMHALTELECKCIPDLMSEALIAECVPPMTETGSVGRWEGFRVLQMLRRKNDWIAANRDHLRLLAAGAPDAVQVRPNPKGAV
ncbi:MAG: phosphotransferase enzyme family protein [Phycisphaerae bacterium]